MWITLIRTSRINQLNLAGLKNKHAPYERVYHILFVTNNMSERHVDLYLANEMKDDFRKYVERHAVLNKRDDALLLLARQF